MPHIIHLEIAPRWNVHRYLFSDGYILDVRSPYNADSTDREAVLAEAARQFGPYAGRKIEGVARLSDDGAD